MSYFDGLTADQVAWLNTPSPISGQSPLARGRTLHNGALMKFKFTTTPLKDIPLGTVVDGYKITERSHTGKNAIGWRNVTGLFGQKRLEQVLLIYSESEIISEKV